MITPPSALVVCHDQSTAQRILQVLSGLGCQPEWCDSAHAALNHIRDRRQGGRYYHLLVAELSPSLPEGASLISQTKRLDPRTVRCLLVHPTMDSQARLAVAHHLMALPPTTSQLKPVVAQLLGRADTASTQRQPADDPTPFFGTRRLAPSTASLAIGTQPESSMPEHEPPAYDPFEEHVPESEKAPTHPTTSRARQPATGSHTRVISGTQRVRRSITGSLSREQEERKREHQTAAIGSDARQVRCAHCGQGFRVAIRERAYATPCIHCGGMNTIGGGR